MSSDEIEIYQFVKSQAQAGQFVPSAEICRRVGRQRRFHANPRWAAPLLAQMVEKGILEPDKSDGYRISPALAEKIEDDRKRKRWLSPHIQRLFESSGKGLNRIAREDDSEMSFLAFL